MFYRASLLSLSSLLANITQSIGESITLLANIFLILPSGLAQKAGNPEGADWWDLQGSSGAPESQSDPLPRYIAPAICVTAEDFCRDLEAVKQDDEH